MGVCDCRIVTHSVSSSFSLIPDRLVMRLRMKMAMPIQMWRGFRLALIAEGVQGNKKAQRPTNHYSIGGQSRGGDVKHHSIEIWWSINFTMHEAVKIMWQVIHQAIPCGIPAKWIEPLWRSQSSCVMNTDEGCCWHCENQRQHTSLAQPTPLPWTTALHGPTYSTTCSRWEEHGTGLWLRERQTDTEKKENCIWISFTVSVFLDMVWTWWYHVFLWSHCNIPGSHFFGRYHVHYRSKIYVFFSIKDK